MLHFRSIKLHRTTRILKKIKKNNEEILFEMNHLLKEFGTFISCLKPFSCIKKELQKIK